jgi:hypothetical protein
MLGPSPAPDPCPPHCLLGHHTPLGPRPLNIPTVRHCWTPAPRGMTGYMPCLDHRYMLDLHPTETPTSWPCWIHASLGPLPPGLHWTHTPLGPPTPRSLLPSGSAGPKLHMGHLGSCPTGIPTTWGQALAWFETITSPSWPGCLPLRWSQAPALQAFQIPNPPGSCLGCH